MARQLEAGRPLSKERLYELLIRPQNKSLEPQRGRGLGPGPNPAISFRTSVSPLLLFPLGVLGLSCPYPSISSLPSSPSLLLLGPTGLLRLSPLRFQTVKADVLPCSTIFVGCCGLPSESSPAEEQGSIIVGLTAIVGFLATGGRKCPERAEALPGLCGLWVRLGLALAPAGGGFCCWAEGGLCSDRGFPPPL